MSKKNSFPLFHFFLPVFAMLLGACSPAVPSIAPAPSADLYRATPEADSPAAGICASYDEETIRVEITAWPDNIPQPRCIKVRAEQKLVLVNRAPETIEFTLGRFHGSLEPGGSFAIDLAFGEYLAPGAHSLHIVPYGGPEIYLESPSPVLHKQGR